MTTLYDDNNQNEEAVPVTAPSDSTGAVQVEMHGAHAVLGWASRAVC